MRLNNSFRLVIGIPFLAVMILFLWFYGLSPETALILIALWVSSALLFCALKYRVGRLRQKLWLWNVALYSILMGLVAIEYLSPSGSIHGISKEGAMFLTAWALSGFFELVWLGFRKKGGGILKKKLPLMFLLGLMLVIIFPMPLYTASSNVPLTWKGNVVALGENWIPPITASV